MSLIVKQGKIFHFSIYDLANEINLHKIEKLLKQRIETQVELYRRLTPKYLKYQVPPLLVKLVSKKISIAAKKEFNLIMKAKIYDFGVVSIVNSIEFNGSLKEMHELSTKKEFIDLIEKETNHYLKKLIEKIKDSFNNPSNSLEFNEFYYIFYVKEFEKPIETETLLNSENKKELARLVRFDENEFSEEEIENIFEDKASYYSDDLVLIDLEACFIYDKIEPMDLLDVIEYAKIQLLELRYYDEGLDKGINKAYDEMKIHTGLFANYNKALYELGQYKLTITEIVDRIDNALKLIGDNYLARVYLLANNEFYLEEWKKSVNKKLTVIEDIYSKLNDQAEAQRHKVNEIIMLILEFLIVVFFAFEIWKNYFT